MKIQIFNPLMTIALVPLAGCAAFTPFDLANPTNLTVEDALRDVGAGFAGMREELDQRRGLKLGLYPCKVTVNLNVTADAAQGGKLTLDASTAPSQTTSTTHVNTVTASGHVEQTNTSTAHRGNTVVVEMYSVPCIPKDTLGGTNPSKVRLVSDAAERGVQHAPFVNPRR